MYVVKLEWGLTKEREFEHLQDLVDTLNGTGYEIYHDDEYVYSSDVFSRECSAIEDFSKFPSTIDYFLYARISGKPLDVALELAGGFQDSIIHRMDKFSAYLSDLNKSSHHIVIVTWNNDGQLDYTEITDTGLDWSDLYQEAASELHCACFTGKYGMPVSIYVNGMMKYITDHVSWVRMVGGKMHFSQRHSDAVVAQLKR